MDFDIGGRILMSIIPGPAGYRTSKRRKHFDVSAAVRPQFLRQQQKLVDSSSF